ncbi:MAG: serine/threonine-protein kinase [Planctomycetota bacterium]|nr:serine/threonine-protein kinase [Planctomycetota bacterium]
MINPKAPDQASSEDEAEERFADLFDRVREGLERKESFDPKALAKEYQLDLVMVEQCLEALDALSQFQDSQAPILPQKLGPYRLMGELGSGGMGEVYQGQHHSSGEMAAIKIIRRSRSSSPAFLERFQREATALKQMRHPNIVSIYEVGHDGDWTYIAMEYVEGETLADYLGRVGPLSASKAGKMIMAVAEGLAHVHEWQWLHRDIKPQNILIERSGRVLLADFGIAKDLNQHTELTESGEVLGTLAYLSPEQLGGAKIDHRADIYSLGATLYHMLFGKVPSKTAMVLEFPEIQAHSHPQWVLDICRRCLESDLTRRYTSVNELIGQLRASGN